MDASEDLRYPIGKFVFEGEVSEGQLETWIAELAEAPAQLRTAVDGLSMQQLETPYRPGGWTVRQVVHHLPDSHINCYVRFRLALTEEEPLVKTYAEDRWAELADARSAPVETSLALFDALHERWIRLLRALSRSQWKCSFLHPENGVMPLDRTVGMYAWHGRHHVAHILAARKRMAAGA